MPSPTADDVVAAANRMKGMLHTTQVNESLALNNLTGARVLVKCEALQKTGTFKIRGALNRVLCLSAAEKANGVIAFSSGNFGQGLAAAAASAGVGCTIVMPGDAPANKQARAVSYGATVVLSEIIEGENREITAARIAEQLAQENGYTLLHPFEDYDVIAGQGTAGLELIEYCHDHGIESLDAFLVQTGGGGLTAGCCLAMERFMPTCQRFSVEPETYDDHARSFHNKEGKICPVEGNPPSICDALQAAAPGKNTWPINKRLLTDVLTVTDEEVRYAMKVAFETLQVVLEPSGAVALAAVLANKINVAGRTIGLIASGGNLDVAKFAKIMGCPQGRRKWPMPIVAPAGSFDWTGFKVSQIQGFSKPLLAVQGAHGFLACAYFNIETANQTGEAAAIVSGVSTPEEMLASTVIAVSDHAAKIGVKKGMLGSEALEKMRSSSKL